MDDASIQQRINKLIAREHELRTGREAGTLAADDELRELKATEVELDQCWDLLRQRQARREFGESPENAQSRSESVVEHYLQ
ncbi:MAG: DUF2630 family protein [Nocardioides sp.]